jgi:murein tripeptide amidase MpaA
VTGEQHADTVRLELEAERHAHRKDNEYLLAEIQRLRDALERIAENAEAWHGPHEPGNRFQGALSVVGEWSREALRGGDAT